MLTHELQNKFLTLNNQTLGIFLAEYSAQTIHEHVVRN